MVVEIAKERAISVGGEVADLEREVNEQAINRKRVLCRELGLDKQIELLDRQRFLSNFPYCEMTEEEYRVYGRVFPTKYCKAGIKEYRFDCIPNEVLELWFDVKRENVFDELEIWTPEQLKVDPLLVGIVKKFSLRPFLLARWGEALLGWEEIKKKAEELASRSQFGMSQQEIQSRKNQLSGLQAQQAAIPNQLVGGWGAGLGIKMFPVEHF